MVVLVSIVLVWLLISFGAIFWNLSANDRDKVTILNGLKQAYPDLHFRGSTSYEKRRVSLQLLGTLDEPKQEEVRGFLVRFKVEHNIRAAIWLLFNENSSFGDPDTIKF